MVGFCIYHVMSLLLTFGINMILFKAMSNKSLSTAMSSSIMVLLPPLLPVTDNDHGAWVITVSTILLIMTILATTVTLISRIRVLRKISWSDSTLFLSCVSAFAFNNCSS